MTDLQSNLKLISESLNCDIAIYNGDIDNNGADKIFDLTQNPKHENILFIMCTPGGDAHAAFKIARRLQQKYSRFYLCVYGICKSAGTIIAIGADEILMNESAEFGPLDVQLQEKDEILRYSSGLNIDESLRTLRGETMRYFHQTMLEMITSFGMSTKTAAELATNLAIGFITPIVSQIDPVRVGETQRAVKIAMAYGERLIQKRGNLKSVTELAKLVQGYPDHAFVIDFDEAETIFKKIRKHNENETVLGKLLKDLVKSPRTEGNAVKLIYPGEQDNEPVNKQTGTVGVGEIKGKAGKGDTSPPGKEIPTEPLRVVSG